jgi:hypothetical protein
MQIERIGYQPQTIFVVLQPGREIGSDAVDQVLLGLVEPSYSTRYRKAKESKGLMGSFGDKSWSRKAII